MTIGWLIRFLVWKVSACLKHLEQLVGVHGWSITKQIFVPIQYTPTFSAISNFPSIILVDLPVHDRIINTIQVTGRKANNSLSIFASIYNGCLKINCECQAWYVEFTDAAKQTPFSYLNKLFTLILSDLLKTNCGEANVEKSRLVYEYKLP